MNTTTTKSTESLFGVWQHKMNGTKVSVTGREVPPVTTLKSGKVIPQIEILWANHTLSTVSPKWLKKEYTKIA